MANARIPTGKLEKGGILKPHLGLPKSPSIPEPRRTRVPKPGKIIGGAANTRNYGKSTLGPPAPNPFQPSGYAPMGDMGGSKMGSM
jgi:hypothetical protein